MPLYAGVILALGWAVWVMPFFLIKKGPRGAARLDRRARIGILLEAVAYSLVWQVRFWEHAPAEWRVALSTLFLALAGLLSWNSARTLGKQWRLDAGLNADHELVRTGAYSVVRHPIYTSMLCLLLGFGFMVAPLPLLGAALVVFMIGTEIRVRIEDGLLASRFGEQFREYQRTVGAYIPFLKTGARAGA